MDLVSTSFALGLIRAEMNVHFYTYFHVPSVIKLKNDHPDLSNCAKITCFLNWIILGRSVQNKQDRKHWRLTRFNTNTNVILESQNNLWQCHIFLGMSMLVNIQKRGVDHGPQHGHVLLLAVHNSHPSILQPDVAAGQVWIHGILYFPLCLTVVSVSLSWVCFPLGLVSTNCSLQTQHCGWFWTTFQISSTILIPLWERGQVSVTKCA